MNYIKKVTLAVVFSLLSSMQVAGEILLTDSCKQLEDFPFVFVSDYNVKTPPAVTDSLFDAVARGIRFTVNSTMMNPADPFVELYRTRLAPWLRENNMVLRQMYVKGAASPEGPYDNNVWLSRERTKKLIAFLNGELGVTSDSLFPVKSTSITEDYGLLVKMMGQAGDPQYQRVKRVFEECGGDEACCKRRLMALDRGRLWRRLLRQYFPALRQARVVLWFSRKPEPPKPQPAVVEDTVVVPEPPVLPPQPPTAMVVQKAPEPPVAYERRHLIAARTNLLHDFFYWPDFGWAPGVNLQLEYYPLSGHLTYNAGFTFTNHRRWQNHKFFQIRDLQLEVRRYFKGGGRFIGPYLGVYAEGTVYGIGFSKTRGWEGEGGGGGLSLGWTWKLNRKGSLRLEASVSLGAFITRYDPYIYNHPYVGHDDGLYYYDYYGNAANFKKRNYLLKWFGPTNAGLHVTYDIIYRKKKPVGYYEEKGGLK